jgi:CheY-like chemotaxis protein
MTSRRILFCDDDPDIREIIEIALSLDAEFELKSCGSAAEALAAVAAWRPDLVLLDVMMPGLDGPTALSLLQANPCTTSIPVVFMTARTQAYECQRFISLGAAGIIAKPFNPMTLTALVRGFFTDGGMDARGRERLGLRLEQDKLALARHQASLRHGGDPAAALAAIRDIVQELAIAMGVCGFCGTCGLAELIVAAQAVEQAATVAASGRGHEALTVALDRLLTQIPPHGLKALGDRARSTVQAPSARPHHP